MRTLPPGLRKEPDGTIVVRAWWTCPRTGKRRSRQMRLPPGTTPGQALRVKEQLAAELEEEAEGGGARAVVPRRTTVADYAVGWLERKAHRLRASTRERYVRDLAEHVLPHIGQLYVGRLLRSDVQMMVAAWEQEQYEHGADGEPRHYGQETLTGWWRISRQLLQDAAADHQVADPTVRVRAPKSRSPRRRESRTLTAAELRTLLEAVEALSPGRHVEVYLLAWTGMRTGEIYALQWQDIDWRAPAVNITRAHVRGIVGSTKIDDPRRVPLLDEGVALLRSVRALQAADAGGAVPAQTQIVFPPSRRSRTGFRNGQTLQKPLDKAVKALGLDVHVTPQVLRRTFNTLAVAANVSPIVLRAMMGHTTEAMTGRYAGVGDDLKRAAVEQLRGGQG